VNSNPEESVSFGQIRKKFGFGFGSRHCCKIRNFVKNRRSYCTAGKLFPLSYRFHNAYRYKSNERHHFKKFRDKILVVPYRYDPNPYPNPNPKKICGFESEKNEFGPTTLKSILSVLNVRYLFRFTCMCWLQGCGSGLI
jgi:hypothetical protein